MDSSHLAASEIGALPSERRLQVAASLAPFRTDVLAQFVRGALSANTASEHHLAELLEAFCTNPVAQRRAKSAGDDLVPLWTLAAGLPEALATPIVAHFPVDAEKHYLGWEVLGKLPKKLLVKVLWRPDVDALSIRRGLFIDSARRDGRFPDDEDLADAAATNYEATLFEIALLLEVRPLRLLMLHPSQQRPVTLLELRRQAQQRREELRSQLDGWRLDQVSFWADYNSERACLRWLKDAEPHDRDEAWEEVKLYLFASYASRAWVVDRLPAALLDVKCRLVVEDCWATFWALYHDGKEHLRCASLRRLLDNLGPPRRSVIEGGAWEVFYGELAIMHEIEAQRDKFQATVVDICDRLARLETRMDEISAAPKAK
jgi:hypothetical protein